MSTKSTRAFKPNPRATCKLATLVALDLIMTRGCRAQFARGNIYTNGGVFRQSIWTQEMKSAFDPQGGSIF